MVVALTAWTTGISGAAFDASVDSASSPSTLIIDRPAAAHDGGDQGGTKEAR